MSNQSPSIDSSASHQARGQARTPRHVQWANDIDEDGGAGGSRDHTLESEIGPTHELDEAGLDVCRVCSSFSFFLTHSFCCSQPVAFRTLTHALERHRSSSASPSPAISAPQLSRPSPPYTSSVESSVPASPGLPPHEIGVPGEAFIEPHERAGLPMPRSEHKREGGLSDSEIRAAHVVRAHSRNPFSKRFYHRRSRSPETCSNERADQEKPLYTAPPMTRTHGGILAALLTLYDQDSDTVSESGTMTATSSGTPEHHPRISPAHSLLEITSASRRRLANVSKALHLPEHRPRRERNAAGVWGPLIASTTGTLVGAAAPTHSTLAPDVKRPGYQLSRYVHCLCYVSLLTLRLSQIFSGRQLSQCR